ncbi:hypothetical protein ACFX2C_014879 [Malus domestica]
MFCMFALLWRVKVDSYRKFFNPCREIFDKLSVISAKLSVHVTGVDEAEKDWCLFDIWDRRFDKLPVIFAELSLRVTGADASGKASAFPISELASSIFELASSNSELASSISEIPSSADFYRGTQFVSKHT